MGNNIYNALEYFLLLFVIFIGPALICGILMALPSLSFIFLQRFSNQRFPKLSLSVVSLTCICSFGAALFFTTRAIIGFEYELEIPYGYFSDVPKNSAEKQLFDSSIINEATYRSLVPLYLQRPCTRTPRVVCKLGSQ